MMKSSKNLLVALLLICLLAVPFNAYADNSEATKGVDISFVIDNTTCTVNGVPVVMDTAPQIYNGRTLLPIRYVATPLGAQVGWDGIERKVTVALDGTTIEMWIDNPLARVNGFTVPIDPKDVNVKPIIINSRTMLPVRFVSQELNCQVGWNGETRQVSIAKSNMAMTPDNQTALVNPNQNQQQNNQQQNNQQQNNQQQNNQQQNNQQQNNQQQNNQQQNNQQQNNQQQNNQQQNNQQQNNQQQNNQQQNNQQQNNQQQNNQQQNNQQQNNQQQNNQQQNNQQQNNQQQNNQQQNNQQGQFQQEQQQNQRQDQQQNQQQGQSDNGNAKEDDNQKGDDNAADGSNSLLGEGHFLNGQSNSLSSRESQQLDAMREALENQNNNQVDSSIKKNPALDGAISNRLTPNNNFGILDGSNLQLANQGLADPQLAQQIAGLKQDFEKPADEQAWKLTPQNQVMQVQSTESDIPIVMRLGRGYDVFGEYASVEALKYPVLDIKRLVNDGAVERIRLDKGINYQTAAKSIKKYSEKMTVDTKISGDYLCFGGSVSTNFDTERTKKLDTYFSTYSYLVQKYAVYINQPKVNLKEYVLPSVSEYINNKNNSPSDVFANYGHYVLVDSITGGRVDHSISAKAKESTSFENFKLATKASFNAVVFGADAEVSYQNVKNKSKFDSTKDERLTSQGGAMTLNLGQFKNDKKALQNWEATLEDNGTLVAFGKTGARGLVPIWELCDTAERSQKLKDAFKTLNDQKVLADKWPSELYIKDIKFVTGKTAAEARAKCSASNTGSTIGSMGSVGSMIGGGFTGEMNNSSNLNGYYLIDMDLNKKAGGRYIYLCYKLTEDPDQAITDLFAELSDDIFDEGLPDTRQLSHNGNVATFTRDTTNLNFLSFKGMTPSKPIFLWTTRDKTREPLKALEVIYSRPNLDHEEWDFVRWQNGSNPANMNETAGGKFITILFKR